MKSNLSWVISSLISLIFSLHSDISLGTNAGKLGDTKYVMLLAISWSHVAVTEIV